MQLHLILRIAQHSETCLQRLHVLPRVARYAAANRASVMQTHTVRSKYLQDEYFSAFGRLHREDLPAIVRANGDKVWYYDGKYVRSNIKKYTQWNITLDYDTLEESKRPRFRPFSNLTIK